MSSRTMSPGGSLLRASRVFAIPNPLPRPGGNLSSTSNIGSDTQTLPYPTHASITSPQSSRKRGDWGLKRQLPLRSTTKTSTPFIRVKAIDTIEHITDYESSADHTLNLQKFLEMNLAISTPSKKSLEFAMFGKDSTQSVFEDEIDQIAPPQTQSDLKSNNIRWKFDGPWIAGQSEGDFNTYVQKVVRKRKPEFQNYLRKICAETHTKEAQKKAREQGEQAGPAMTPAEVTDQQLREFIISLRDNRTQLYRYIRKFLDLPPSPGPNNTQALFGGQWSHLLGKDSGDKSLNEDFTGDPSPYAESGPPATHPSAGLSYSRTSSHTFNHPLYGPQKTKPPVQSRIVMPKAASTGAFASTLGMGGFVVDIPPGNSSFDISGNKRKMKGDLKVVSGLQQVELDKYGGSKVYLQPTSASVDTKGRIVVTVDAATPEAVSVLEGKVDEIPEPLQRSMAQKPVGLPRPLKSSDEGYGLKKFGDSNTFGNAIDVRADTVSMQNLSNFLLDDKQR